jgi:uncharacterized membrane protein
VLVRFLETELIATLLSALLREKIMDTAWYYFLWVLWTLALLACLAATFANVENARTFEWILNIGGFSALVFMVLPSTPKRLKTKKG